MNSGEGGKYIFPNLHFTEQIQQNMQRDPLEMLYELVREIGGADEPLILKTIKDSQNYHCQLCGRKGHFGMV